ncbi:MAG: amidohydrolase family protein [Verrucomicrobiota bacterium]
MPLTRRQFLAATAVSATLPAMASAQSSPTSRTRIDCQSHLFCPELVTLMEKRKTDPRVFTKDGVRILQMGDWLRKIPPLYLDVDAKLATMDAAGIQLTALSINDPGPEWFGADGPTVAQLLNDYIAGLVKKHPTRFFGLCVLPLQDMRASLVELDRCVKQLGMKGILLYTNLAGKFADEPEFRPLFARAVELDVPVLLHPAKPITTEFVKAYEMTSTLGNMFDNTIALTRLLMSGLLDEFPKLKLVCPHLGGTLPYIVGRLDHQVSVLKRGPRNLTRKPSEYLQSIWMDVVSPLPLAVKFGHDFIGPDRLLFSSDHPWVEPSLIIDTVRAAGLPASSEEKIFSTNARKLFRI